MRRSAVVTGDAPSGVRCAGVGSAAPAGVLSNADLEKMVDTTDAWILQRTGIRERRIVNPDHESVLTLSRDALRNALDDAGMVPSDLDLIIVASVSGGMLCPSTACRLVEELRAEPAGAFDLAAACSGFLYALNVGDSLVRSGRHRAVGVIGCDTMSTITDYTDRGCCILFGDAAGAAVLVSDDDPSVGCLYQTLHSDGRLWRSLYIPQSLAHVPEEDADNTNRFGTLRMNGREIFKFAVTKFREIIEDALEQTGLGVDDISQFICHQSNQRIIAAAVERLGLPWDKVHMNIEHFGNSSAGSVGLCFDQAWRAGKFSRGDIILLVAFGGGLTWASSVWRM
jgi:3-oxoacyl-[acyl-carrier-protein] synthase-3